MTNPRIELNRSGVRELLRSDEMKEIVEQEAEKVAKRCGDGYATDTHVGTNRVNSSVMVTTWEAYDDNMDNNTILKALR